jgi:hypothetical protein
LKICAIKMCIKQLPSPILSVEDLRHQDGVLILGYLLDQDQHHNILLRNDLKLPILR